MCFCVVVCVFMCSLCCVCYLFRLFVVLGMFAMSFACVRVCVRYVFERVSMKCM